MHICLVAEGCYPYIVGGVSSWLHSLISNCPEHTFSVIAINPEKKARGQFKFKFPKNLIEVQEVFLDEAFALKGKINKRIKLTEAENATLVQLLNGEKVDWHVIFELFSSGAAKQPYSAIDFMLSRNFYDLIQASYGEKYAHIPFTEVFWNLRSMYLILFYLIENDYIKADLYHSVSTGYAGVVATKVAHQYNKPLLLTEHGIYTREREEEIIKSDWIQSHFKDMWIKFFKNLSDAIYSDADQVLTLFNKNKAIQVELGCPEEKIQVIHNGVRLAQFASVKRKPADSDKMVVAAIVRIVPIKDIKTMLQAFSIVARKIANVEFLIIGPTDENEAYYEECQQYAEVLNMTNVRFTGRVDIRDYLGEIDVHVLSSISEGQPLTILETLINKIPNVTTDVGDCASLIYGESADDNYGQAGYVVNIMDFNGIAKAIIKLLENPQRRREFGENGYQRVVNRYAFAQFIESYQAIYRQYQKGAIHGGDRV